MTAEQARVLGDLLSKLEWSYTPKPGDDVKFIQGEKLPESVKKLLTQAHTSEMKLATEAMKLMKKVEEGGSIYKGLKKGYTEAQQHITDLKHISDFKELPNSDTPLTQVSFNEAMAKIAKHAESFNETVESAKGHVRAKSN